MSYEDDVWHDYDYYDNICTTGRNYGDCSCADCRESRAKAEKEEMRELIKQYRPDDKSHNLAFFNFFYEKPEGRRIGMDNRVAIAVEIITDKNGLFTEKTFRLIHNLDDYFAYLDALRDSSLINMGQSTPHLIHNFPDLSKRDVKEVLELWMEAYKIEEKEWRKKAQDKRIAEHKRRNGR